jgi:hypothetical protein
MVAPPSDGVSTGKGIMSTRTLIRTGTRTAAIPAAIPVLIGPADIELPPTEPIDLTALAESIART